MERKSHFWNPHTLQLCIWFPWTPPVLTLVLVEARSVALLLTCVEKEMVAQVGDFAEAAVAYVAPAEKGGRGVRAAAVVMRWWSRTTTLLAELGKITKKLIYIKDQDQLK